MEDITIEKRIERTRLRVQELTGNNPSIYGEAPKELRGKALCFKLWRKQLDALLDNLDEMLMELASRREPNSELKETSRYLESLCRRLNLRLVENTQNIRVIDNKMDSLLERVKALEFQSQSIDVNSQPPSEDSWGDQKDDVPWEWDFDYEHDTTSEKETKEDDPMLETPEDEQDISTPTPTDERDLRW